MRFKHSSVMKNSGEHRGHMWRRDTALRLQSEAKSVESTHSWDQNPGAWILAGVPPTALGPFPEPSKFSTMRRDSSSSHTESPHSAPTLRLANWLGHWRQPRDEVKGPKC